MSILPHSSDKSSSQALPAPTSYPAAQLRRRWKREKKRGRGENANISKLSTHKKKSYFRTGNWSITHKRVLFCSFLYEQKWLFGMNIYEGGNVNIGGSTFFIFLCFFCWSPLATQFADWWIAVRLLSTVCSLCSRPHSLIRGSASIPSNMLRFSRRASARASEMQPGINLPSSFPSAAKILVSFQQVLINITVRFLWMWISAPVLPFPGV